MAMPSGKWVHRTFEGDAQNLEDTLDTLMLTEGKLSGEGMRKIECTERVWLLITVNILLLFSQDRSSLVIGIFF